MLVARRSCCASARLPCCAAQVCRLFNTSSLTATSRAPWTALLSSMHRNTEMHHRQTVSPFARSHGPSVVLDAMNAAALPLPPARIRMSNTDPMRSVARALLAICIAAFLLAAPCCVRAARMPTAMDAAGSTRLSVGHASPATVSSAAAGHDTGNPALRHLTDAADDEIVQLLGKVVDIEESKDLDYETDIVKECPPDMIHSTLQDEADAILQGGSRRLQELMYCYECAPALGLLNTFTCIQLGPMPQLVYPHIASMCSHTPYMPEHPMLQSCM